jgi:T4 bacteriophage base plate protein
MSSNPLKQYFRQARAYVKLPTLGKWYTKEDVYITDDGEVGVYALTALDDIMLNTPDAMLNGRALEQVITNCCPDIKNVKKFMLPDLEVLYVGIKSASNNGRADYDRKCPKCEHENTFELNCQMLLDTCSYIDPNDTILVFDGQLEVHIKPYTFEMRQLFLKREFEEERALRAIDNSEQELDELQKADILGQSVSRLSEITFALVSQSIEKIVILKDNTVVSDLQHINEWLTGITKVQADMVIEAVNKLNATGVQKTLPVQCQECGEEWEDQLTFDPSSFFGKRS